MKIILEPIGIEMTEPLETFVDQKFGALAKLIKHLDENGDIEIRVELSRSTKSHKKGDVYCAAADLRLPKKMLRAEEGGENIRSAIVKARDVLKLEIEKYKTKDSPRKNTGGKAKKTDGE